MAALLLSYVAGVVTIFNPCILPIVPIIVATALGESRFGPAALAAGLVLTFSTFGFLLIVFGFSVGLSPEIVRVAVALLLIGAGIVLMFPAAHTAFASAMAPLVQGGNRLLGHVSGQGVAGQFTIGSLLGLVWTPCVGPTLGVAIASASQGKDMLSSFAAFFLFGLGVATALLIFAYGAREALSTRKATFQSVARSSRLVLGMTLVAIGIMIATGLDKRAEAALTSFMPGWLVSLTVGI